MPAMNARFESSEKAPIAAEGLNSRPEISLLKLVVSNPELPPVARIAREMRRAIDNARDIDERFRDPRKALEGYNRIIEDKAEDSLDEFSLRLPVATALHEKGHIHWSFGEKAQALSAFGEIVYRFAKPSLIDEKLRVLVVDSISIVEELYDSVRNDETPTVIFAAQIRNEALKVFDTVVKYFLEPSLRDVRLRQSVVQAQFRRAVILCHQNSTSDAISAYNDVISYREGLRIFGGDTDDKDLLAYVAFAYFNKGILFHGLKRFEEAVAAYQNVVGDASFQSDQLTELVLMSMFRTAEAYGEIGRFRRQIGTYEEVASRFSDVEGALREYVAVAISNKARIAASRGLYVESIKAADELERRFASVEAEEIAYTVASISNIRGDIFNYLGFRKEAVLSWKFVINHFRHHASARIRKEVKTARGLSSYDSRFARRIGAVDRPADFLNFFLISKSLQLSEQARIGERIRLIVSDVANNTITFANYVSYIEENSNFIISEDDVSDLKEPDQPLLEDSFTLLSVYLEARGIPRDLRPYLIRRINKMVDEAKAEILLPTRTASVTALSDEDRVAFEAHAKKRVWKPHTVPPSSFIEEEFARWFERGLRREDITKVQPKLTGAYAKEIERDPTRRLKGLIERPRNLPAGTPARPSTKRSGSRRLVSELSPEELEIRRKKTLARTRRARARAQGIAPS
jgi:tetratricopeptide (TPR) repeat protein